LSRDSAGAGAKLSSASFRKGFCRKFGQTAWYHPLAMMQIYAMLHIRNNNPLPPSGVHSPHCREA
jgi:hypothetical protein